MMRAFEAVAKVLQTYFDGLYFGDSKRLGQVFHAKARYVCATEDKLVEMGMEEYFPIVDRRPSPASRNEPRQDRIVAIEFAGPKTAFARVNCAIGPKRFTDLLSLVLIDGRWQIISKNFHFDLAE
jgi:hypothetical protein